MPEESELSFEAAVSQLESIVEALEKGETSLAAALAQYETGVRLLTRCYAMLDQAERSVALLTGVDAEGKPAAVPFDATATIELDRTRSGTGATAKADPETPATEDPAPKSPRTRRARPAEEPEPNRGDPPF